MKHIYVSPHADDVALSCGGQIIANSASAGDTMVLTVFTSDSADGAKGFADALHAGRMAEDRAAWGSLGIEVEHLDLPEALLRGRFPFALRRAGGDREAVDRLCAALREYAARFPGARFRFPAGIGQHVDHLLCRDAGFRLLDEGAVRQIGFYEDAPYGWLRFMRRAGYRRLLRRVTVADRATAMRRDGWGFWRYLRGRAVPFPRGRMLFAVLVLALLPGNIWRGFVGKRVRYAGRIARIGLSDEQQSAKRRLLRCYPSQWPMLFGPEADRVLDDRGAAFDSEVMIEVWRAS